jgi:hypothetical protein
MPKPKIKGMPAVMSKNPSPEEEYQDIIAGIRKPTVKQADQEKKYREIWALLVDGKTDGQVAKIIGELHDLEKSQQYKLIRDCKKIFGDVEESNKKAEKIIAITQLKRIAQKADKIGDYKTAVRAWETIARVHDYFKDDMEPFDPGDWMTPQQVTFSNDPKVLKKEQGSQDIQDADFEEIDK